MWEETFSTCDVWWRGGEIGCVCACVCACVCVRVCPAVRHRLEWVYLRGRRERKSSLWMAVEGSLCRPFLFLQLPLCLTYDGCMWRWETVLLCDSASGSRSSVFVMMPNEGEEDEECHRWRGSTLCLMMFEMLIIWFTLWIKLNRFNMSCKVEILVSVVLLLIAFLKEITF